MRLALAFLWTSFACFGACSGYGESDAIDESPVPASDAGDAGDATNDVATLLDGGADGDANGAACDLTKPFGPAVEVAGINTPENELNLWLSEDEKTAYVTVIRAAIGSRYDIYTTSRASMASPFGALVRMNDLDDDAFNSTDPTLSQDGLTVVFATQRSASDAGAELFTSTRGAATTTFAPPVPLANVNADGDDQNPFLTTDGLELFWNSPRLGSAFEIVHAVRGIGGPFGAAENAGLGANSSNAVLSRDGLTIFYGVGDADIDIWTAHRTSRGAPFTEAKRVDELATAQRDVPQWLSPDGCRLYFMSNRPGTGGYDQWVAERPR